MRTKVLGRTGIEVPIVGLGTAFCGVRQITAADTSYDKLIASLDEKLGVATIHAALEAGSTLIDTAALYGGGKVESIIGRALRERPDLAARATVTTKAGRTLDGPDHSYDAVMRSVETSLRRVGLERFAVVYIHDTMGVPMQKVLGAGGALPALQRLKEQGVIGAIGTATDDPEINAAYIETGEFDAAVAPRAWSLINLLAERRILPAAVKHNVGLVMATTLERGLLAHGPRQGIYYFDRSYSPALQANVAEIQALCEAHGIPLVAVALQWCVRHPQIAATIPGARTPDEARINASAAEVPIPDAFWQDLAPLIHDWGDNSNEKRAGAPGASQRD